MTALRVHVRENWYRDLWLFLISVVLVLMVLATTSKVDRQREGREVAVGVMCGAVSAVTDAGRATISASARPRQGNERFVRNLERLGYPSARVRRAQAKAAASAYVRAITAEVVRVSGRKDLVAKDGSLDCAKLAVAVGTANPR